MNNYQLKFCIFGLFLPNFLYAQDDFGGHPLGLDWQILTSDAVRVIYPKGMEPQAQRTANLINYMEQNNNRSVGAQKHRFDLVLRNQTTNPNGYAALAPLRSEFFCTPPQNNLLLGSNNWMDELAIHEYRHILQYANTKRGLTRWMYWLQGELAWGGFQYLSVPNWYLEGDAVITETALTNAGRGRSPFFTLEQRALALAGKDYSYMKHRNLSYKDLLPDWYQLGYMMLSKTRQDFGNDLTAKVLHQGASYRYFPYPFSKAMKKNTGHSTKRIYELAWTAKKAAWAKQLQQTTLIPTTPVTQKPKKLVTNYAYPRFLSDSSMVVRKSSFQKTDAIVLLKDGNETELTSIGVNIDENLTLGHDILAWNEFSKDARWGNRDYSDIFIYNLKTKQRTQLTHQTRYFSPSVSPDGSLLATISISPNQENQMHLLDPKMANIVRKIENPKNYSLSRTAWTADSKNIIAIARKNSQLALVKFDLSENTVTELTQWTSHTMESPIVQGQRVYFNASFSGIDNIFYTDLNGSKAIYAVTSVPVGAFEPDISADGKTMIFTEATEMGRVVSKQNLHSIDNQPISIVEPKDMPMFQTVANQTEGGNILEKPLNQTYPTESYHGLLKGLKLHSWMLSPSIAAPSMNLGITNILNDVQIDLEGGINLNERSPFYNASVSIARYYPIFTLSAGQNKRQASFYTTSDTLAIQKFDENVVGGDVSIPLKWFNSDFTTQFKPTFSLKFRQLTNIVAEHKVLNNNVLGTYDVGVSFSHLRRKAVQNVGTRLGIRADLRYIQSLNASSNEKIVAKMKIYLPGLLANHNIEVKAAFQKELLANRYQFSDDFEYPRGYVAPINDDFKNISITYGLPLMYPDWGFWGLTYFRRIRANLFLDNGIASNYHLNLKTNYRSTGYELIFDNQYFNLIPITLGLRQSFLLEKDPRNQGKKSTFGFYVSANF
jgi:hypothetical protein